MLLPPINTALFFFSQFFWAIIYYMLTQAKCVMTPMSELHTVVESQFFLPSQGKTRRQVPLLGQPPPRSDFKKLYPNSDPGLITNLKLTILCMVAFLCSFLLQKLFNFTYWCWIRVVQGFRVFFCCIFFFNFQGVSFEICGRSVYWTEKLMNHHPQAFLSAFS